MSWVFFFREVNNLNTIHPSSSHKCLGQLSNKAGNNFQTSSSFVCRLQSSRPWRSHPGGVKDAPAGSAHPAPDAAHRRPDRFGHGLPGIPALRPPRPGNPQLSGGGGPGGEDRRFWHVQRHLQHRLLSGEWLPEMRPECCVFNVVRSSQMTKNRFFFYFFLEFFNEPVFTEIQNVLLLFEMNH